MMQAFQADMKHALSGRRFLLAVSGMLFCIVTGAFSNAFTILTAEKSLIPLGYHAELLLTAISGKAVLLLLPVLSALPFAWGLIEEKRPGFISCSSRGRGCQNM